jgi:hypothetical protein
MDTFIELASGHNRYYEYPHGVITFLFDLCVEGTSQHGNNLKLLKEIIELFIKA